MGVGRVGLTGKYRRIGKWNFDSECMDLTRRVDMLCIPFRQWGGALIFFTGKLSSRSNDDTHVVACRKRDSQPCLT